jgi:hypothetical protein
MRSSAGLARQFRDMSLYDLGGGRLLVTACDAAAGIGEKPADTEPAQPESVGYFCARVAVLELLTLGAAVCSVSCTLGVEREPTGRRVLAGVRQLLCEELLADRVAWAVSSENNFPCGQTGVGVTVTGVTGEGNVPWHVVRPYDQVALVGSCLVGRQARIGHPDMVLSCTVRELVACEGVHEVIPVGSGGVRGELAQLEARGIRVLTSGPTTTDLNRSGGPATAMLVIASPDLDLSVSVARSQPWVPIRSTGQVADVVGRTAW